MLIHDNILPVGPSHNYQTSGKFAAVTFGAYFAGHSILRMLEGAHAKRASAALTSNSSAADASLFIDMKERRSETVGLELPTDLHAIPHSKKIAHRLSHEHPGKNCNL